MKQWNQWSKQAAMLVSKRNISTKLLLITTLITLFNIGSGILIYTQNLSVSGAVKDSRELSNAERQYKEIEDSMLQSLLLMIDTIENGSSGSNQANASNNGDSYAERIQMNLKALPEMLKSLEVTFQKIDRKYPVEDGEMPYANVVKVFNLAFESLNNFTVVDTDMTSEMKSLRVRELTGIYTITLNYASTSIQERMREDVADNEKRLERSVNTANTIIIINVILLAVLPFLMSYALSQSLKKGLKSVMARINAYKNSDFTFEQTLNRHDELGEIDRLLSEMGGQLRDTIKATLEVSGTVLSMSNSMGDMIGRNRTASEGVSSQIKVGTATLLSQYDDASSISAVTEQISASSEEIAASTEYINGDMQQMRQSSMEGSLDMEGVVDKVNQTVEQFELVKDAFGRIVERFGNVTKFLGGIQDLNTQTNLLSLNASIESARAGEHGRGFAVVAEEIRKLSGQTETFSKNITKELHLIQGDISSSSDRLNVFAEVISTTKTASVSASEMFKGLERQSGALSEQVKEISTAIGEITAGMTHIVTAVDKLLHTSQDVNGKMELMTGLSGEQNAVSDQLSSLAEDLKQSSVLLKEKASIFKV
ncbi:methyl-accepting chemotaxis protein [Paenibacillus sp. NEAU-GSW1]|uniref:methyl-accepting chemotaxis protein n=1 Tax=Paenibacillus sp. NEAU-GSW1 TaxID=2682486 RepID=UPI0012E0F650|nr:methyl-accepting chemotaxis protein [Paenibacillus sp. NEAU-GSW1]MUT66237.1 hypothetical protein [Paenibacillus sp. NEAU-GSW1]